MRLLQRYVLYELLTVFTFLVVVLTVLLVFVVLFRQISESGLGPMEVLQILPFAIPSLLPFTIPATLLLTVCVVYGRLAGDNEITAAKAAGINVLSLLWPSFFLGAVLSVGALFSTDQVIPWAMQNIQRIVTQAMEKIFIEQLRSNHSFVDQVRGYEISVMDVQGETLISPVFEYAPPGHGSMTIQAETATIDIDLELQQLTLHLVGGRIDMPGRGETFLEKDDWSFPLPYNNQNLKPRHMSIQQINKQVSVLSSELEGHRQRRDIEIANLLLLGEFERLTGPHLIKFQQEYAYRRFDLAKYRTEIHSRFALSCSCLFFALVGGPFAISQARRQFLTSFFICFLPILVVYYPTVLLMMNLSKTDRINPAWSVWMGNALLAIVAAVVLRKVLKN